MRAARGFVSMAEVIGALVLRETRTRFGAHQLGYLWALFGPIMMILTFYLLFSVANRKVPEGMDLFSFLATGIVPYQLFSNQHNRIANAIRGNRALLFYPHVYPLDLVFARCLLEVATFSAVFIALVGANALYRQEFEIDSALRTISGFGFAALLGMTVGLVLCTLDQFSRVVDRARGPLFRPMFWISGIFFTANELPDHVRELVLYNPLLHCVELVRDGWFRSYTAGEIDLGYVGWWVLVLGLIGLTLERAVRRRIELT